MKTKMSFRTAHRLVGKLALMSEKLSVPINILAFKIYGQKALEIFDLQKSMERRNNLIGSTGPKQVAFQLKFARERIQRNLARIRNCQAKCTA